MNRVKSKDFGASLMNNVQLFTLRNKNGVEINITNYGATITSIVVPNKLDELENIACGFDHLDAYFSETYKENAPYFGCTVGRYCSQIKNSTFSLNGKTYQLDKNCGENNLHGGRIGFDKKIWSARIADAEDQAGLAMSLVSQDMEEGFPGNVEVNVTFTLNDRNELEISYLAVSDQDTPLTLTNHTYFNLSGFKSSIEGHSVRIAASNKLAMDDSGAATGEIVNLENRVDDLRTHKEIRAVHQNMNDGFEHYYIFDKNNFELEKVADFTCEESGRSLTILTTEPGMLFYTGKYTSDSLKRENGQKFGKFRGFCCETHRYPNGPNISNSPGSIIKAGDQFTSTTIFRFN